MKSIYAFLILTIFVFISCGKDLSDNQKEELTNDLNKFERTIEDIEDLADSIVSKDKYTSLVMVDMLEPYNDQYNNSIDAIMQKITGFSKEVPAMKMKVYVDRLKELATRGVNAMRMMRNHVKY